MYAEATERETRYGLTTRRSDEYERLGGCELQSFHLLCIPCHFHIFPYRIHIFNVAVAVVAANNLR